MRAQLQQDLFCSFDVTVVEQRQRQTILVGFGITAGRGDFFLEIGQRFFAF